LGFAPIWQTVLQIPAASTATFESFWLTFSAQNPAAVGGLQTIMVERKIELFPDPAPPTALSPASSGAEHRTLYKSGPDPTGDEDVIPLQNLASGSTYTIETLNLSNGADTLLFITDASNVPITGLQNDNRNRLTYQNCDSTGQKDGQGTSNCPPNDGLTLSSSITFVAPSAGPFNAHVKRSPVAPPSAGLFGSYDIQLKGP
ncbi:MAG TPA: hypothetical protein VFA47_01670, partial [Candidatus Manganitrophaceae bacterium]|nr:hypothetical protein [Candidatus Manganitrophaceae bacterium]